MNTSELKDRIESAAYLRIEISPVRHIADRLQTNDALDKAISASNVSLRGWPFPRFPDSEAQRAYSANFVECWTEFQEILELWRFYKSAQFAGLFRCRELGQDWQVKLRDFAEVDEAGASGYLSHKGLIFSVTEAYELASRLAKDLQLTDGVRVHFALNNANGYALSSGDGGRPLFSGINESRSIPVGRDYTFSEIATRNRHLALEAVSQIFRNFSVAIRPDVLRQIQDELYALKLGEDGSNGKRSTYEWDDDQAQSDE